MYQYTSERGNSAPLTVAVPLRGTQRGNSVATTAVRPITGTERGNSPGTTTTSPIRWEGGNSPPVTGEAHIPYDRGLTRVSNTVNTVTFPENQGPSIMVGIRAQQRADMNMAKAQTTKPRKPSLDLSRNLDRFADATARKNATKGSYGAHAEGRRGTPLTNFNVSQALRSYSAFQAA